MNKSCGGYLPRAGGARETFFFQISLQGAASPALAAGPLPWVASILPHPAMRHSGRGGAVGPHHGTLALCGLCEQTRHFCVRIAARGSKPGRLPRI